MADQMVDNSIDQPAKREKRQKSVVEDVAIVKLRWKKVSLGNVSMVDMWPYSQGLQADLKYKLKIKWPPEVNFPVEEKSDQLRCHWCRLNGGDQDWIGANLTDLIRHVIVSHRQFNRRWLPQRNGLSPCGKFWVESKKISIELWKGPRVKRKVLVWPSASDFIILPRAEWQDCQIKVKNICGDPVRVRLEAVEFFGHKPEIFVLRYKNSLLSTSDKQLIPSSSALSTTDEQLIRTDWSHLQPSKVVQLDLSVQLTAKHESLTVAMAFLVAKESRLAKAEVKTVVVRFLRLK